MIKITFHYRYRKQIFIALIVLLLVASIVVAIVVYYPKEEKKSTISIINKKETNKNQKEEKENEIMYKVDVKGEIISPGIYTLPATSRVIDQTTPNMIQRLNIVFERNPLISRGI